MKLAMLVAMAVATGKLSLEECVESCVAYLRPRPAFGVVDLPALQKKLSRKRKGMRVLSSRPCISCLFRSQSHCD
jgi:hypothetical protein